MSRDPIDATADIFPASHRAIAFYDLEHRAFICLLCSSAINRHSILRHLRSLHKFKQKEYAPLMEALERVDIIERVDVTHNGGCDCPTSWPEGRPWLHL